MHSHVSASKTLGLVLTKVYCEATVPSVTSIAILEILVEEVLEFKPGQFGQGSLQTFKPAKRLLAALRAKLKQQPSFQPGRSAWDILLSRLWAVSSLDNFHELFRSATSLLRATRRLALPPQTDNGGSIIQLSHHSPLGLFVRRSLLEFSHLPFQAVIELWDEFLWIRQNTYKEWMTRNVTTTGVDSNQLELVISYMLPHVQHSMDEAASQPLVGFGNNATEASIEHQFERLQVFGARVPKSMLARLSTASGTRSLLELRMLHFLRYLDAWRLGDYSTALENLHRHFDYAINMQDRVFYQYALLNLAILHSDFEAFDSAILAISEAIATAREQHDTACLNFSLAWLFRFTRDTPRSQLNYPSKEIITSEREALAITKAKAKEIEMWDILCTTHLEDAHLVLKNGENVSQAFESLHRAIHVSIAKNVRSKIGACTILRNSIVKHLGADLQARLQTEIFRQCYQFFSPFEDRLKCHFDHATKLANSGKFDDCLKAMSGVDEEILQSLNLLRAWKHQTGTFRCRRLILQNRTKTASGVLGELETFTETPGARFSNALLRINLQAQERDYRYVMNLLNDSWDDNTIEMSQRLQLLIARFHILVSAGFPQKAYSLALRAATLSYRCRNLPILWASMSCICNVLNGVQNYSATIAILESIIPRILEDDNHILIGTTCMLLADSRIGQISVLGYQDSLVNKHELSKALRDLDAAFQAFDTINDVQSMAEISARRCITLRLLGDTTLSFKYAISSCMPYTLHDFWVQ